MPAPPAGDVSGLLSADGVASSPLSATAAADWIPLIASFLAQSRADPRAIWTSFTMIIVGGGRVPVQGLDLL